MREITRIMLNEYRLKDIDFMGYVFNKSNASFHHLIIPKRLGGKEAIYNGAILNADTSHPYLHVIEALDYDRFLAITSEMLDENILGRLDKDCIARIDDILSQFEKEHSGKRTSKGKVLIKPEYVYGRKIFTKKI